MAWRLLWNMKQIVVVWWWLQCPRLYMKQMKYNILCRGCICFYESRVEQMTVSIFEKKRRFYNSLISQKYFLKSEISFLYKMIFFFFFSGWGLFFYFILFSLFFLLIYYFKKQHFRLEILLLLNTEIQCTLVVSALNYIRTKKTCFWKKIKK